MGIWVWRSRREVRRTWDATCESPLGTAARHQIRGNNGQRSFKIASSQRHFGLQMFFHGLRTRGRGIRKWEFLQHQHNRIWGLKQERRYRRRLPLKDVGGGRKAEDWPSRDNQRRSRHSAQETRLPPLPFAARLRSIQGNSPPGHGTLITLSRMQIPRRLWDKTTAAAHYSSLPLGLSAAWELHNVFFCLFLFKWEQ